jgi:hypothetical protein
VHVTFEDFLMYKKHAGVGGQVARDSVLGTADCVRLTILSTISCCYFFFLAFYEAERL